jgi:hypothetical protein
MSSQGIAFVHVPKTGTVSIGVAVEGLCTQITHHPWEKMTAAKFRRENPDSFIFGFVRNPFSRLVSAWLYFHQPWIHTVDLADAGMYVKPYPDFQHFIMEGVGSGRVMEQRHCRPQASWITDESGRSVLNFIGSFERLQEDFDRVCQTVGWPRMALEVYNSTQRGQHARQYATYYDEGMVQVMVRAYAADFELGGYEKSL